MFEVDDITWVCRSSGQMTFTYIREHAMRWKTAGGRGVLESICQTSVRHD